MPPDWFTDFLILFWLWIISKTLKASDFCYNCSKFQVSMCLSSLTQTQCFQNEPSVNEGTETEDTSNTLPVRSLQVNTVHAGHLLGYRKNIACL